MNYGTIGMVNDYLPDQLNAVTEDGISQDELDSRLKQAKAVSDISQQIIANGKLALEATKVMTDYCRCEKVPDVVTGLLGDGNGRTSSDR